MTRTRNISDLLESDGDVKTTHLDNSMTDVVDDTTPQLGGNLDLNNQDITGTGNVNVTGSVTATSFSGDGSSLTGISAGATNGFAIAMAIAL